MFRKFMPLSKQICNQRFFSSCNNRCKVDEVTNKLVRQELYLKIIDDKIGMLAFMSVANMMLSIVF